MRRLALIAVALGALAACKQTAAGNAVAPAPEANSGTQVKNATGGMIPDRSYKSPAEHLFVDKCGMCHRAMGMGTVILARRVDPKIAMLEQRNDLTRDYVITAARNGIGNMPRMQRGEVSDQQLAVIAGYLAKGKP